MPRGPVKLHTIHHGKRDKTYKTRDSLVVTDPTTDLALLSNLCFGRRGIKKQGVSVPKTGRLFPSVSAIRVLRER